MNENVTPVTGNEVPDTLKTENGFSEPETVDMPEADSSETEATVAAPESEKPQPSYYQYNPQKDTYVEPEPPKSSGLAIAGMVCGIVALVLVCCLWPLGLILGITGLVLSIVALKKKQSKGMSVAGIVTSALGILLGAALGIFSIVFMSSVFEVYENTAYEQYFEYELYDNYDKYDFYNDYEGENFIFEDLKEL